MPTCLSMTGYCVPSVYPVQCPTMYYYGYYDVCMHTYDYHVEYYQAQGTSTT